ncbi:MAG TPA: hypothetical protein PLS69_06700, partial [Terricaulis sp.]|nr:hypothetical protein [Terricaulis sp.]
MRGKLMFGAASAALLAFAFTAPAAAQEADPAADASTQARLTLDQPVNGAIDPAGDGDWYRLSVSQGQRYTITLNAAQSEGEGALDPMLGLYDSSGEQIGFNDDAGGTLNSQLSFAPSASGDVFIEARAFADASTGAYTLAASATVLPPDDAGNDAGTRARIRAGQPVNGALEYEGDADWYRFDARSGYSYRVTLVGAEGAETPLGDPLLMVMNDAGDQIAYNDDDDGLNSGLDFTVNRSGRVFIVAGAFADAYAGAYTLNVESTRLPPDPASADIYTRARVNAGQSVEGAIDYAGDRDWHRIRLTAGQTYRFALNSTGESPLSDPYLRLYNARGDEVAADDDGGGDLNALLEYTAETTGNYFVEAGAFADSGTGGYTLQAREGDIPGDASTDMRL